MKAQFKEGDLVKVKTALLESALSDYWGLCIVKGVVGVRDRQLYASVWSIPQNRDVMITVTNLVLVEQ